MTFPLDPHAPKTADPQLSDALRRILGDLAAAGLTTQYIGSVHDDPAPPLTIGTLNAAIRKVSETRHVISADTGPGGMARLLGLVSPTADPVSVGPLYGQVPILVDPDADPTVLRFVFSDGTEQIFHLPEHPALPEETR